MIFIIYSLWVFIVVSLITIKSIHIMQLNSYNIDQQIIWYKKNIENFIINFLLFAVSIFTVINITHMSLTFYILLCIANIFLLIIITGQNIPKKQKKKLVWTKRIIRMFIANIIFLIFVLCILVNVFNEFGFGFFIIIGELVVGFTNVINFLVFLIMTPIENLLKLKYINSAKKVLNKNTDLSVIGITGSYGKTTTKHFLYEVLSKKYMTCKTEGSFNTPMGICMTINNNLKNIDDLFITEMGARRKGDIKEICDIVKPDSCIITSIGAQHLDTFKNIENVVNTKFELVDSVLKKISENKNLEKKNNNIILLNTDNEYILNKYNEYTAGEKKYIWTYGLKETNDFYVKNIRYENLEVKFDFVAKKQNVSFEIETKVIGEHNIINIIAVVSFSLLMEIEVSDIQMAIKNLKQVEHRLELKKIDDKTFLIDDAYNSNPIGARNAVKLLLNFNDYKKIIITPGMVELGDKQYDENFDLGVSIAKYCDSAIIVGKTNKDALSDGIRSVSNDYESKIELKYFDDFKIAYEDAMKSTFDKKIILIENDLPDNY